MPLKSRKTKQKETLGEELKKFHGFFTAEDFYDIIKKNNISIATIYRFLKQKSDEGELHIYRCNGKILYSVEKRNHSHFICKQCGNTTHFNMKEISEIRDAVKGEMCHFQLDVYGICDSCKKKSKSCDCESG